MTKLVLIALLVLGAASLSLARPAPAISIDLAGNGSINVSTWTYGGDYTAHFCDSATISYPDGPNLSVLFVTNYSVSDGSAEYLDANVSGTSLIKSYDPTKGRLTISGVASVATYQQVLRTVYYVNKKTSPTTGNRDIEVEAFYGNTGSNAATCTLSVRRDPNAPKKPGTPTPNYPQATPNPTKEQLSLSLTPAQTVTPPYVDLSGGNGGPNYSTWTYGGSQYWAHICPNAVVSYPGTLTSATLTLTNRPDGSSEYLAVQNFSLSGLRTSGYNPGTGQLTVNGSMNSAICQALLRSIIYVDLKPLPNTSDRKITIKVSAGLASGNLPAVTMGVAAAPSAGQQPQPNPNAPRLTIVGKVPDPPSKSFTYNGDKWTTTALNPSIPLTLGSGNSFDRGVFGTALLNAFATTCGLADRSLGGTTVFTFLDIGGTLEHRVYAACASRFEFFQSGNFPFPLIPRGSGGGLNFSCHYTPGGPTRDIDPDLFHFIQLVGSNDINFFLELTNWKGAYWTDKGRNPVMYWIIDGGAPGQPFVDMFIDPPSGSNQHDFAMGNIDLVIGQLRTILTLRL